jgi:hypothetical protein
MMLPKLVRVSSQATLFNRKCFDSIILIFYTEIIHFSLKILNQRAVTLFSYNQCVFILFTIAFLSLSFCKKMAKIPKSNQSQNTSKSYKSDK